MDTLHPATRLVMAALDKAVHARFMAAGWRRLARARYVEMLTVEVMLEMALAGDLPELEKRPRRRRSKK